MPALMAVVLGVLLGGTGALIALVAWPGLAQSRRARRWPTVEGRIVAARAARIVTSVYANTGTSRRRDRVVWIPELTYEYTVGERVLRGARIGLGAPTGSSDSRAAESFVAPHPVRGVVTVCVDPANPANAVLDPAPTTQTRVLLAVAVALVVGAFAVPLWLFG